ncbi:MAG: hypothetical protein ACI8S6_003793 [Myxococcota bacterium]|jgi:hypothetical protein
MPTASLLLLLQVATAAPSHVDDAAVIVSIEDYVAIPDVPGARAAGQEWYRYFVEERGILLSQVSLLEDSAASREEIEAAAQRARDQVGEGGVVWFVFIGNSTARPGDTEPLLVGWDAQRSAELVMARSLRRDALITSMEGGAEHETVLMLDAVAGPPHDLMPLTVPASPVTRSAVVVSGERPLSPLILGALRGAADANRDSLVTVGELRAHTRSAVGVEVIAPSDSLVLSRLTTPGGR